MGRGAAVSVLGVLLRLAALRGCSAFDPYELSDSFVGADFFKHFEFWSTGDPTGGAVRYVGSQEATQAGMVRAQADGVYIGADMDTIAAPGEGRRSVRVQSKNAYNAGLFVVRARHVPTGCGLWPALWMYGEDAEHPWPSMGEFDIMEAVHEQSAVVTTLHTSAKCAQRDVVQGQDFSGSWLQGANPNVLAVDCDIKATGQTYNEGCSQMGRVGSYGTAANSRGGGTYAAEWDPDNGHIRVWFWPAGAEPGDLQAETPNPDSWGTPYSYFSIGGEGCSSNHFVNMRLVINVDFCGDLGEAYWQQKCPDLAKEMTCRQFVEGHPGRMADSYWLFDRVDVYQRLGPLASGRERTVRPPAQPFDVLVKAGLWIVGTLVVLYAMAQMWLYAGARPHRAIPPLLACGAGRDATRERVRSVDLESRSSKGIDEFQPVGASPRSSGSPWSRLLSWGQNDPGAVLVDTQPRSSRGRAQTQ